MHILHSIAKIEERNYCMYRPSMYSKHDDSLSKFVEVLNACPEYPNIVIEPILTETYIDDGNIIESSSGNSIGFDWEFRDKYFENGEFKFSTLGQYERKIIKPSIKISIQCDSTESHVAVAWHEDWKIENVTKLHLSTDVELKEYGRVRYTKYFKIFSYEDIAEFKGMIYTAFQNKQFNKSSFPSKQL